jgi:hypothetical protein
MRFSNSQMQLTAAAALVFGAAAGRAATPGPPNPCKLATVAEIEKIVGPLKSPPKASDPSSGAINCSYRPAKGPSHIDLTLHDGPLAPWKRRNGGKNPAAAPEFGADAFVTPDYEGSALLFAKHGDFILHITIPKGPQAVDIAKAIARKALPRL